MFTEEERLINHIATRCDGWAYKAAKSYVGKLERIKDVVANYQIDTEPYYDTEDYMNSIIEILESEGEDEIHS